MKVGGLKESDLYSNTSEAIFEEEKKFNSSTIAFKKTKQNKTQPQSNAKGIKRDLY